MLIIQYRFSVDFLGGVDKQMLEHFLLMYLYNTSKLDLQGQVYLCYINT